MFFELKINPKFKIVRRAPSQALRLFRTNVRLRVYRRAARAKLR